MTSTKPGGADATSPYPDSGRFHYHLLDVAGREVDMVDRSQPLHVDETITLNAVEAWRVVAVLGASATVVHA